MPKSRLVIAPPEDERFKRTFFLVEASSFERLCLWQEWHKKVKWEPSILGCMGQIGTLDGLPVILNVFWVFIEGRLIGFWEFTSEVTDHRMAEKWFDTNCKIKRVRGLRRARCNAMNFSICMNAIRAANE